MNGINRILSMIEKCPHSGNTHEFLSDIFELGALAIANRFDFQNKKEEIYKQIFNRYDSKTKIQIIEIFAEIMHLLTHQLEFGFDDYLGKIYMASETSSKKAGQFFTPYHISKMCASLAIEEKYLNLINNNEIIKLNEPSCGAGGLIVATADVLYNKYHVDYTKELYVECSDLDRRCVHMAYIQLSFLGIPAIVSRKDALSGEVLERWKTPSYILQYKRFS